MGSDETVSVNRADLEAVLFCFLPKSDRASQAERRLRAALTPPAPWSPTDQEIDAYCEAWPGLGRSAACQFIIDARKRGFDAVPRRLSPELP